MRYEKKNRIEWQSGLGHVYIELRNRWQKSDIAQVSVMSMARMVWAKWKPCRLTVNGMSKNFELVRCVGYFLN